MATVSSDASLHDLQQFVLEVYGVPDDRHFSLIGLLSNQARFTMRTLKAIRKGQGHRLQYNLAVALSWAMAVANRLHISAERAVAERFRSGCYYCQGIPCRCETAYDKQRTARRRLRAVYKRPISTLQGYFAEIYPPQSRTLQDAGIHLAEEMEEVTEAAHAYLGSHQRLRFREIESELADFVSCVFAVANSAGIEIADELAALYRDNCHVCHMLPCSCKYSKVVAFRS